jgi:hypothetical protein
VKWAYGEMVAGLEFVLEGEEGVPFTEFLQLFLNLIQDLCEGYVCGMLFIA